jgi:hypothetical protein
MHKFYLSDAEYFVIEENIAERTMAKRMAIRTVELLVAVENCIQNAFETPGVACLELALQCEEKAQLSEEFAELIRKGCWK